MFKPLRKADLKMEDLVAKELLTSGEYGVLSTICSNGYPYGVPMSYVYFNDAIYFHGAAEGHKHENIVEQSKVSFCVVGKTQVIPEQFTTNYESVIVFGQISVASGPEKLEALFATVEKYCSEYSEKGKGIIRNMEPKINVLKMSIDHISGKLKK